MNLCKITPTHRRCRGGGVPRKIVDFLGVPGSVPEVQVLSLRPKKRQYSARNVAVFLFCKDLNLKKADSVKQNSPVDCFVAVRCVVVANSNNKQCGLRSNTCPLTQTIKAEMPLGVSALIICM